LPNHGAFHYRPSAFRAPGFALSHGELRTTIHVAFNRDGSVVDTPQVIESPAGRYSTAGPDAVVRAVLRCAPYKLPAEKYDTWREIEFTFDPVDIFP
jgi:hypothetical protein